VIGAKPIRPKTKALVTETGRMVKKELNNYYLKENVEHKDKE
jgi:hypothetical protein